MTNNPLILALLFGIVFEFGALLGMYMMGLKLNKTIRALKAQLMIYNPDHPWV